DAAGSRPGVERPRPRARGGPPPDERGGGHVVVRIRRAQRDARPGTRRMSDPVAITGGGGVCALGIGVEAFWEALAAGRGGRGPGRRAGAPRPPGGGGAGPGARRFAFSAQARRIDRTSLLALAAAQLALADAGLTREQLVPASTGVGLGSAFGNLEETAMFLDRVFERGTGNPMLFPNLVM